MSATQKFVTKQVLGTAAQSFEDFALEMDQAHPTVKPSNVNVHHHYQPAKKDKPHSKWTPVTNHTMQLPLPGGRKQTQKQGRRPVIIPTATKENYAITVDKKNRDLAEVNSDKFFLLR